MPSNDQDYRRAQRVACTMRAPLATNPLKGEFIEDSSTMDLSESGVRLRLRGEVAPGQLVEVYLTKRPEPCRVVWTKPGSETNELIAGLEFLCPLPDPRHRPSPPFSKFEPIN